MASAAEAQHQSPKASPSTPNDPPHKSQVQTGSGVEGSTTALQMFPMMLPPLFPGFLPQQMEQNDNGPGIYAVPYHPFMGPVPAISPNMLIFLNYKIPTRTNSTGQVGEAQGQEGRQQHVPQRQVVVRRFHFAFQLDLSLILKLAAVVFLFSQEGSRQRLILLVLFATLVYLYQTGVLPHLIQLIRRGGAPAPPAPQPRPLVLPENGAPNVHNDRIDPIPEGNYEAENQQQHPETENAPDGNENQPEPERRGGINWLGIVKEIQTFVVGFVTSLLPGFHHND